jgi:hypothetical protein
MRIRAAILAAALVAAPLRAQGAPDLPTADEARAVLAAVLAHQASVRGPESGAQTCVAGALAGAPAPPDADDPMVPEHAVRIRFQWHAPEAPAVVRPVRQPDPPGQRPRQRQRAAPIELPAALAPALADRLSALRAEAARAAAPALLSAIDAALVPAPLSLQGADDCAPLTLSAPAFAGDAAFVEFTFACGTVCGNGGLYALERRAGRWEVVGVADIWIS